MNEKNNPAIQPGEGARAIDTFHKNYTSEDKMVQLIEALRAHQMRHLADGFDYLQETILLMSFLAGYSPMIPLKFANEIVTALVKERRQMK